MLIVLDYRNFVKNLSYSIMSSSIACAFPTEPQEIAHRIMKRLYCIRAEHPTAKIIIANDLRPYWRHNWIRNWYSAKGLEPVTYKGNRDKVSWPFATQPADMEQLYARLLVEGAKSIGAIVVESKGLEADDIWGLIAEDYKGDLVGYSGDSDWCQKITNDGRITVWDFTQEVMRIEPADIRIKWIGGDSGDNIRGCTKLKKDGTPAKNGWGKDGATKLLEDPNWKSVLDPDELERNRIMTTLPCPLWDVATAVQELSDCSTAYEQTDEYWDRYGVTAPVRKSLQTKADREAFLSRLRLFLVQPKDQ